MSFARLRLAARLRLLCAGLRAGRPTGPVGRVEGRSPGRESGDLARLRLARRSACGAREARPDAALALAACLLAAPLARPAGEAAPCAAPGELEASAGHTTAVRCDGGPRVSGPARLVLGLGLDPNTADAASLEVLPGIGPARAQAIVASRCAQRFESPGELERVPGIGPAGRARLAPWLAIDPAAEPECALP